MGISFFIEGVAIMVIFFVLRLFFDFVRMIVWCEFEVNVLAYACSLWADGVDILRNLSVNMSMVSFLGTRLHIMYL